MSFFWLLKHIYTNIFSTQASTIIKKKKKRVEIYLNLKPAAHFWGHCNTSSANSCLKLVKYHRFLTGAYTIAVRVQCRCNKEQVCSASITFSVSISCVQIISLLIEISSWVTYQFCPNHAISDSICHVYRNIYSLMFIHSLEDKKCSLTAKCCHLLGS